MTSFAATSSLPGTFVVPPTSPTTSPTGRRIPAPPREPQSLAEAGLSESDLDALVLKHMLRSGNTTGMQIATALCLPRLLIGDTLERLRKELLVGIKNSAGLGDYLFQLTDAGYQRARQHDDHCHYVGPAPVLLAAYQAAIQHQSIQNTKLKLEQLAPVLTDLRIQPRMISRIAQAVNDGRGMFLYGNPGNGKTTIAERICNAFGEYLWIPRMLHVGGDLIRLYDPSCHDLQNTSRLCDTPYDRRWVLIRRPTVVVGGELTLEQLDTSYNAASGISEAPVHMKANGGALVIDDFGRQRVSSSEILNRLIVPLEKQFDYLNLVSGRQIQVPFDMLFILATNLQPRELVDEAFLRRIPYKIEVSDPTEDEYRSLFIALANKQGLAGSTDAVDYLLTQHYNKANRPLRFCHPRDLLRQIKNYCEVHTLPPSITRECIDMAVENYFGTL